MTRRKVSVQIVCGVEKLLNIVFKKNCKVDSISYPIINLFPSCVSLSRVLNVDKFKVVWSRRLDLWLNRLSCRTRRLTLPKSFLLFYYYNGDLPSLSPPSTSPPLPLLSLFFFSATTLQHYDDCYCNLYYSYCVTIRFV